MSAVIDYTAKRSIKSGHSVDTDYQITVDVVAYNRRVNTQGNQSVALSGSTVSVIHRTDYLIEVTTALIDSTTTPDIDDMREFLDSVSNGESFDIDGTTSILSSFSNPYQETRIAASQFRYSFTARAL